MPTRRWFLLLGLVVTLAACGHDDDIVNAPAEGPPPYAIAFAVGNRQVSLTEYFDSTGVQRQPSATQTTMAVADTLVDGERWFVLESTIVGDNGHGIPGSRILMTNRSDGLWYYDPHSPQYPPSSLNPGLKVGETATTGHWYNTTLVSSNVVIEVPAGRFTTYHYHALVGDFSDGVDKTVRVESDSYWAPGIGFVLTNVYDQVRGGQKYLRQREVLTELHQSTGN